MNDVVNRRRHRRLPASIRIFTRAGNAQFSDSVQDISLGGVSVATRTPLPQGSASIFGIQLPHHDVPLELPGHVVWSRPDAMGVAFDASEPRFVSFIERLERSSVQL